MEVNVNALRNASHSIQSYLASYTFSKTSMQSRHNQIQTQLNNLSNYLLQSANIVESTENSLFSNFKKGTVTTSHYENWNLLAQLLKKSKTTYVSRTIQVNYAKTSATYSSKYFSAGGSLNVGDLTATGSCSAKLWNEKQFDPQITLKTEINASLLSTNVHAKLGTTNIYGYASAKGYAGVAYAKASAVFTKDEQTLEAGIGVAALKGSCSISFHLFGASVTLTGSGSIGSAEANISYSHKSREWEFGTKLGFICGLGFKVHVSI